jgi:hypothetical protein
LGLTSAERNAVNPRVNRSATAPTRLAPVRNAHVAVVH